MDMFEDQGDRPAGSSNLRGWLSDVFFPALLEGALGPLAARLGPRAQVDDPRLGRASGMTAIEAQLDQTATWLRGMSARYERAQFTTGIDRDVTEGILSVTKGGATIDAPVAVVAERRRSREVELRVYYATRLLAGEDKPRGEIASADAELVLPSLVRDLVDALRAGDVGATLAVFEENGVARDGVGRAFGKANGTLKGHFEAALPIDAKVAGYADDGRTCAVEVTVTRAGSRETAPRAALLVLERGDSGLFRAMRVYGELSP